MLPASEVRVEWGSHKKEQTLHGEHVGKGGDSTSASSLSQLSKFTLIRHFRMTIDTTHVIFSPRQRPSDRKSLTVAGLRAFPIAGALSRAEDDEGGLSGQV